jgi:hypothetical protein
MPVLYVRKIAFLKKARFTNGENLFSFHTHRLDNFTLFGMKKKLHMANRNLWGFFRFMFSKIKLNEL